jgi:hypothetical protein
VLAWLNSARRDLKSLGEPEIFLSQFLSTWRILVALCLGELLGAWMGISSHAFGDHFKDMSVGAVYGAIPGLGIGIWWELADGGRRRVSPRPIRLLYILSLLGLLLIGLGNLWVWHLASNNRSSDRNVNCGARLERAALSCAHVAN